ncbi:hypothetical protein TNCV_4701361 [Trichonephila clavipes]|nr:hypothetical protein TNCV_4701361 [Trichonephila clavipes]
MGSENGKSKILIILIRTMEQNYQCHRSWTRYRSTTEKMPRRRVRTHYEQLSEFERGRIIGLKKAGWENRRIARHMSRSGAGH